MKFNCDALKDRRARRRYERLGRNLEWHKVFAFLPHKVSDSDCRWFEVVERRLVLYESLDNYLEESLFARFLIPLHSWEYRSVSR